MPSVGVPACVSACLRAYVRACVQLVGPAAGAATLLESRSRRLELGIYCMSPAIQSFYLCMRKYGYLPKIHYVSYIMFAVAMGYVCCVYICVAIAESR